MLRATEQLTWTAKLDRFKRGCDDSRACPQDQGAWQSFSGSHLTCKVIFTKPIDRPWPSHSTQTPANSSDAARGPGVDRQLRIIVECEEDLNFATGNGSVGYGATTGPGQMSSASQPTSHLFLLDVDLVRINKAYFHTEHRLKAVVVRRQDKCVLIRMLDEHEAAKARRAQLEFCKERDVETFLSLIEPDSTLLPSGGSAMVKSQKEKGKEKAQSLLMRRTESGINERRNKEEYKAVVAHEASQSESQSQSLGEKLLQLNQTRLGQSLASAPGSSSFSLLSQGQHLNYRTPTESCLLHNAHPERVESSTTTPLIEDARQMLSSSSGSLMGVYSGPVSTPLTEATELTNLADEHSLFEPSEQEEAVDDGLSGWPDPSAVECIQDDVCRLCLTDSDLERVIERGVEEHLQDMEG